MNYKIITDTSCDLSPQTKEDLNISYVPFYINIDGEEYIDDENLDIEVFLKKMIASKNPIKTSCPPPDSYLHALNNSKEDNIFVVSVSSKLSGSYNSASIAISKFTEDKPSKNVYLVDSKAASGGQTALVLKIWEIIKEDSDFEQKCRDIDNIVKDNHTYFILENFDNLVKNGRIPKAAGFLAGKLNICPIMKGDDGSIAVHEINRGFKKALANLSDQVAKDIGDELERTIVISHVNALEKANFLDKKLRALKDFKNIIKVHTKGLSSGYADNGGIIVGF